MVGLPKIPTGEDITAMTAKATEPMMLKLTAIEALLAKLVDIEEERLRLARQQIGQLHGTKRRIG